MKTAVGVFASETALKTAVDGLRAILPPDRIDVLLPGARREDLASIPTTEDMPPVGAGLGAALGGALGLGLATVVLFPAIGPVTAIGAVASTLGGLGGAVAGGLAGKAADAALSSGIPTDELYLYEDALGKGRGVVIARARNDREETRAREIFSSAGAESIDAARDSWEVGLKPAEELKYEGGEGKEGPN